MADAVDDATEYVERMTQHALSQRVGHLDGPPTCSQCGEANDRRQDGYAVCSDCVADD